MGKHHIRYECGCSPIDLTVMVAKSLLKLISLETDISFQVDLWAPRPSYLLMKLFKAQRKLKLVSVTKDYQFNTNRLPIPCYTSWVDFQSAVLSPEDIKLTLSTLNLYVLGWQQLIDSQLTYCIRMGSLRLLFLIVLLYILQ